MGLVSHPNPASSRSRPAPPIPPHFRSDVGLETYHVAFLKVDLADRWIFAELSAGIQHFADSWISTSLPWVSGDQPAGKTLPRRDRDGRRMFCWMRGGVVERRRCNPLIALASLVGTHPDSTTASTRGGQSQRPAMLPKGPAYRSQFTSHRLSAGARKMPEQQNRGIDAYGVFSGKWDAPVEHRIHKASTLRWYRGRRNPLTSAVTRMHRSLSTSSAPETVSSHSPRAAAATSLRLVHARFSAPLCLPALSEPSVSFPCGRQPSFGAVIESRQATSCVRRRNAALLVLREQQSLSRGRGNGGGGHRAAGWRERTKDMRLEKRASRAEHPFHCGCCCLAFGPVSFIRHPSSSHRRLPQPEVSLHFV
ncbi:hypothetical protein C8R45DRAFT_1177914 [Mycena sanguinolenta]|nr:hypothetical protein C8R45DRAFT_1177914 [Mycena sanguinolenta]